ncbi:MAG: hypothetical protein ACUVV0_00105 [Anaerolineae bacterium]
MQSSDARTVLKRGIAAAQAGNIELAQVLLAKAVQLNPKNEHGWFWLASVLNREEEIEYCLLRALAINPEHERARYRLGALRGEKEVPVPTNIPIPARPNRSCPICGTDWYGGVRFCDHCGTPLIAQAIPEEILEKLLEAPLRHRFKPSGPAIDVLFLLRQKNVESRWRTIFFSALLSCGILLTLALLVIFFWR